MWARLTLASSTASLRLGIRLETLPTMTFIT